MAVRPCVVAWFGHVGGSIVARAGVLAGALAGALVLGGCQQSVPAKGTGVLQLELGGDNEPLAHQLREAGVVLPEPRPAARELPPRTPPQGPPEAPPGALADAAGPGPTPVHDGVSADGSTPGRTSRGREDAGPLDGDAARATLTVQLADGETLSTLARRHLGKSSRWPEIARLNGWSEAQAKRLRAGTLVRLP